MQGRPSQALYRGHVFAKLLLVLLGLAVRPDEHLNYRLYLIVIAPRGQLVVLRPFESADLLDVGSELADGFLHVGPYIAGADGVILATGGQ